MKRVIDEKGRLFGKISVIDLTVILLVGMIAIGAFVKFTMIPQTDIRAEVRPVQYTLEIRGVRHWAMHNIRVGDAIFDTGVYVGTVVGVSYAPHEAIIAGDGEIWVADVPERYIVWVELEATATVHEGRIMVSRTVPTAVGNSPTEFTSRYAEFHAIVREIHIGE